MNAFAPGTVVPAFLDDGKWSACFGMSWTRLLMFDQAGARRIVRPGGQELRNLTGTGQIPQGRNKAARQFLDTTDGEWLWWIDTDMGFEPDTVERLLAAADPVARPVVGALCFSALNPKPPQDDEGRPVRRDGFAERWLIQPTVYAWRNEGEDMGVVPVLDYPRDALVEAAATGSACILIHRTVLEEIRVKHGDVWYDQIALPTGPGKHRTFSEDLSFCVRLAAVNVPLYIDTSVRTTHDKGFIFLDEETFDEQMLLLKVKRDIAALEAEQAAPVEEVQA